jgi:acyl-CoA thioester hydrolase
MMTNHSVVLKPNPLLYTQFVRVYWEDTDAGGVVFYANYLKFFERARTEWLRSIGIEQEKLMQSGLDDSGPAIFVVSDARLQYHAPARLDDELRITVEAHEIKQVSMSLLQHAWRDNTLLNTCQVRIGCVDPIAMKRRRFPVKLASTLKSL